jgi:hypothetical protein
VTGTGTWKNRPVQPCGTEAAHKRHLRHRQVPCEPCYAAMAAASRRRRAGKEIRP